MHHHHPLNLYLHRINITLNNPTISSLKPPLIPRLNAKPQPQLVFGTTVKGDKFLGQILVCQESFTKNWRCKFIVSRNLYKNPLITEIAFYILGSKREQMLRPAAYPYLNSV
jgi:hypothetical protein